MCTDCKHQHNCLQMTEFYLLLRFSIDQSMKPWFAPQITQAFQNAEQNWIFCVCMAYEKLKDSSFSPHMSKMKEIMNWFWTLLSILIKLMALFVLLKSGMRVDMLNWSQASLNVLTWQRRPSYWAPPRSEASNKTTGLRDWLAMTGTSL